VALWPNAGYGILILEVFRSRIYSCIQYILTYVSPRRPWFDSGPHFVGLDGERSDVMDYFASTRTSVFPCQYLATSAAYLLFFHLPLSPLHV
jgi:hypothetical protein